MKLHDYIEFYIECCSKLKVNFNQNKNIFIFAGASTSSQYEVTTDKIKIISLK